MKNRLSIAMIAGACTAAAHAGSVPVRVTVENLSPTNSISFAPLRIGFGNGTYDSFNNGAMAGAPIVSIAEGGSGSAWFPAFAAAEPMATLGTVSGGGPLLPGASASEVFNVDWSVNRYFTFGSMVVPSNDYFIGNDSPMAHMLFDDMGQLNITSITQRGRDIWDAGSELDGPFGAAFLMGSSNDDHIDENGVVHFDFADLGTQFNGLTTAAGYVFDSQLAADTEVYRITFEIVPAPGAMAVLGLAGMACGVRRRR